MCTILCYAMLGRRKRSSQQFYGQCVSQFVTITTPIKYVKDPDVIVFITYPMMQHAGTYVVCSNIMMN